MGEVLLSQKVFTITRRMSVFPSSGGISLWIHTVLLPFHEPQGTWRLLPSSPRSCSWGVFSFYHCRCLNSYQLRSWSLRRHCNHTSRLMVLSDSLHPLRSLHASRMRLPGRPNRMSWWAWWDPWCAHRQLPVLWFVTHCVSFDVWILWVRCNKIWSPSIEHRCRLISLFTYLLV